MSQFKDLRKAAFAVGFGLAMGKFAAEIAQAAINGVVIGSKATKLHGKLAKNLELKLNQKERRSE